MLLIFRFPFYCHRRYSYHFQFREKNRFLSLREFSPHREIVCSIIHRDFRKQQNFGEILILIPVQSNSGKIRPGQKCHPSLLVWHFSKKHKFFRLWQLFLIGFIFSSFFFGRFGFFPRKKGSLSETSSAVISENPDRKKNLFIKIWFRKKSLRLFLAPEQKQQQPTDVNYSLLASSITEGSYYPTSFNALVFRWT